MALTAPSLSDANTPSAECCAGASGASRSQRQAVAVVPAGRPSGSWRRSARRTRASAAARR